MSFSSSSSAPVGYSRTENPSISSANFRELRTAGSSSITRTTGLTLANSRWVIIMLFPSQRDRHRGKDSISHRCAQVAIDQGQWSQQQSPKIHPAAPDFITNAMPVSADELA